MYSFFFVLLTPTLFCQSPPISFQSDFLIMLQDQQGFLWGQEGKGDAFKSDGYETINLNDSIPKCIGIRDIFESKEGMIWISTRCDLVRYNPYLDRFELLTGRIQSETGISPKKNLFSFGR